MSNLIIEESKAKRKFSPRWRPKGSLKKKRMGCRHTKRRPEQPLLKIYEDFAKNIPKDKIEAMYYRLSLLDWE